MNAGMLRSAALLTAASFALSGCEQLSPGENAAVFGSFGALAAGGIARAAGASTGEAFAIGAATGAIVAVTTYIIVKHQASVRQRRVAEQRGRVAMQRLRVRRARVEEDRGPSRGERRSAEGTRKTSTSGSTATKRTKKLPRYIAVDTEKDEHTSPKAKKAVMIFDTQAEEIVGNEVYDIASPPAVGSTAKFETYSAEYVGTGT